VWHSTGGNNYKEEEEEAEFDSENVK